MITRDGQTGINRQHGSRRFVLLTALALLACVAFVYPLADSSSANNLEPQTQRRRRRTPSTGQRQTTRPRGINYARFSHDLDKDYHVKYDKQGRANCDDCHKLASPLQFDAKNEFRDIKDFPDHPACVNCHRQQFFTGARPPICTVCHKVASPRDERRHEFPKPSTDVTREFPGKFPHGLHQDLLARALPAPEETFGGLRFLRASFQQTAAQEERRQENCALCHESYDKAQKSEEGFFPAAGWPDNMLPGVGTFRKIPNGPEGHRTCFNCHGSAKKEWKSPPPVAEDCGGCHLKAKPVGPTAGQAPAATPQAMTPARPTSPLMKITFTKAMLPPRKIFTFQHDGGGQAAGSHDIGCTTCHINITQEQTLVVKPDVPVSSCAICHTKGGKKSALKKGTDLTLTSEMDAWIEKKTPCLGCHIGDIAKTPPPCSHYYADKRVPPKDCK